MRENSHNSKPSISNFILNDPLIEIVVKLSVIECYLHQVDVSAHPLNIPVLLQRVGTAKVTLRGVGADDAILVPGTRTEYDSLLHENKIAGLNATIDDFDIDGLQSLAIIIEDDLFLEYLINCIRNDIVSYQTFISRTFNQTKNTLISQLNECKLGSGFDPDLMRETEKQLQ